MKLCCGVASLLPNYPVIPASRFNAGRTLHQGIEAGLDLDLALGRG